MHQRGIRLRRRAMLHSLPIKWMPVENAPYDHDLEVCVIDDQGAHSLVYPVRKQAGAWFDVKAGKQVDVRPTHWRLWSENR